MILLKEREGMQVYRDGDVLIKVASDDANREGLRNSWRFLKALASSRFSPFPHAFDGTSLSMEYIEADSPEVVTDTEQIRRSTIQAIWAMRRQNIIHGDLTAPNFILRSNKPVLIDWDQAVFAWEPKPQKRPKPDEIHIFTALINMGLDPSRVLQRWLLCYPVLEYYFGWGRLLDLGTHMGDFCGLAAMSGMHGRGIDAEKIRPCIQQANKFWEGMTADFFVSDIVDVAYTVLQSDVVMMFSTWPYLVQDYGRGEALRVLEKCIKAADLFLFETQLYGDGPGPEFFVTLDDVIATLRALGAREVDVLGTLPVLGRDAERTVLAVRG